MTSATSLPDPPAAAERGPLLLDRIGTPIGEMLLVTDDEGHLCAADFHDYEDRLHRLLRLHQPAGKTALQTGRASNSVRDPLQAYFAGQLDALDRIEVRTGGTAFQQGVWRELRTLPAGQTATYGQLAARIGRPKAVRAVGAANGANPVSIVVPCHRLIGADGRLTGYGGGLARKRWLLAHEGAGEFS